MFELIGNTAQSLIDTGKMLRFEHFCISVFNKKKKILVRGTTFVCTFCYALCLQRNNYTSSHPKSAGTNKSCLRAAVLLCFYFGCLFVNLYKDLQFYFRNVLKDSVTGVQTLVSITSIALLQLLFLSVLCL